MRVATLTMTKLICAIVVITASTSCGPQAITRSFQKPIAEFETTTIAVAAASDLKFAFEEIVTEFNKQNPGIEVQTTFGSSGNIYAQLGNKAPFDLFFSADIDYPRKLIEQGHADKESEFQYAIGHIGVWVRNESPLNFERDGIELLKDSSVQKIAIANPRFAPYGRAAEAALKHFNLYESVKDRLVLGENIAQTAQFVESAAADAGIIAASLARASPLKDKGRFWQLPTDSHPPLAQAGIILSWAKDHPSCERLRAFITSKQGQTILQRYGFDTPEDSQ